jgi:hypothetical protein
MIGKLIKYLCEMPMARAAHFGSALFSSAKFPAPGCNRIYTDYNAESTLVFQQPSRGSSPAKSSEHNTVLTTHVVRIMVFNPIRRLCQNGTRIWRLIDQFNQSDPENSGIIHVVVVGAIDDGSVGLRWQATGGRWQQRSITNLKNSVMRCMNLLPTAAIFTAANSFSQGKPAAAGQTESCNSELSSPRVTYLLWHPRLGRETTSRSFEPGL